MVILTHLDTVWVLGLFFPIAAELSHLTKTFGPQMKKHLVSGSC